MRSKQINVVFLIAVLGVAMALSCSASPRLPRQGQSHMIAPGAKVHPTSTEQRPLATFPDAHTRKGRVVKRIQPFDVIDIRGSGIVDIEGSQRGCGVFLENGKRLIKMRAYQVRSRELRVDTRRMKKAKNTPHLLIRLPVLTKLQIYDDAQVRGTHLKCPHMVIYHRGTGDLDLQGYIDLRKLVQTGTGSINIRWVDTQHHLVIRSNGSGLIRLAGTAPSMDARLAQHANFDGRYLRLGRVFIKARQFAHARLLVLHDLSAFASNQAEIFYYKDVEHVTEVTRDEANILQLAHWE